MADYVPALGGFDQVRGRRYARCRRASRTPTCTPGTSRTLALRPRLIRPDEPLCAQWRGHCLGVLDGSEPQLTAAAGRAWLRKQGSAYGCCACPATRSCQAF
jgi:hypothetical protein